MKKTLMTLLLTFFISISLAEHAVLFISLGMPDNVLKAYFKQSDQYHIPLVIRGLYREEKEETVISQKNSFTDTVNRVKKLVDETKVGGVSIDPILFRAFAIHAVPALVIYDDNLSCIQPSNHRIATPCSSNYFDVIYGNLPIKKLLSIIANKSDESNRMQYAQLLLEKIENKESSHEK